MGFAIMATRGTAARIRESGLAVTVVNKVLEGRPHCVDAIRSGEVQLVVNTASTPQSVADSFAIRRSALTQFVPHYTTLAGARAAVHAIAALKRERLKSRRCNPTFADRFRPRRGCRVDPAAAAVCVTSTPVAPLTRRTKSCRSFR